MPIILDDILHDLAATNTTHVAPPLTPKFFSSSLTGTSTSLRGLLSTKVNPANPTTAQVSFKERMTTETTNTVRFKYRPVAPVLSDTYEMFYRHAGRLPLPDFSQTYEVTETVPKAPYRLFYNVEPHTLTIVEPLSTTVDSVKQTKEPSSLHVLYRCELYAVPNNPTVGLPDHRDPKQYATYLESPIGLGGPGGETALLETVFTTAPLDQDTVESLLMDVQSRLGLIMRFDDIDYHAMETFFSTQYNLHDRLVAAAATWSDPQATRPMSDIYGELIELLADPIINGSEEASTRALSILKAQIRYLESYTTPLEASNHIHAAITKHLPAEIITELRKLNLNLLMADTLSALNAEKDNAFALPTPSPQMMHMLPARYSKQQRNAITTNENCALVLAAAGTGKTTTIIGRIDYLTTSPDLDTPPILQPNEILSLSFTNAAADNITERKPGITAKTIAAMINEIYTLNHPTHQLSANATIANSIQSYFPTNTTAERFTKLLHGVRTNEPGCMTRLNIFVEQNFDDVIAMLNRISQVSLELQQIITYQKIRTMAEPPQYNPKCLIIDEVQDNSIFEFIFALEYVRKHKAALYIVGDPSQTLYEFRAANPKALNALERSGVFSVFPLTTNYRSNAEILMFANAHLANIETNNKAQLRLEANELRTPSAASFAERVHVDYEWASSRKAFDLSDKLKQKRVKEYIESCFARGEKVAFLAWYRYDIEEMKRTLAELYPGEPIANLTSDRMFDTTMFSKFTATRWNTITQVDPMQAPLLIVKEMKNNLPKLTYVTAKNTPILNNQIHNWWMENARTIKSWQQQLSFGTMNLGTYFDNLKHSLLRHEILINAYASRITNEKNRLKKEENLNSDARIIVSTIHGAKGLEFDNVVLFHQYKNHMSEDTKRMYYVALTRAMHTEYIISTGNVKNAEIENHRAQILDTLLKREKYDALVDAGYDPEMMEEEAITNALEMIDFTPAEAEPLSAPSIASEEPAAEKPTEEPRTPISLPGDAPDSFADSLRSLGITVVS